VGTIVLATAKIKLKKKKEVAPVLTGKIAPMLAWAKREASR